MNGNEQLHSQIPNQAALDEAHEAARLADVARDEKLVLGAELERSSAELSDAGRAAIHSAQQAASAKFVKHDREVGKILPPQELPSDEDNAGIHPPREQTPYGADFEQFHER